MWERSIAEGRFTEAQDLVPPADDLNSRDGHVHVARAGHASRLTNMVSEEPENKSRVWPGLRACTSYMLLLQQTRPSHMDPRP